MAICQLGREGDPRDVMIALAVYYYVAQRLGQAPARVFNDVASCLPAGWIGDLLRDFGARQDVTFRAFGWQLAQTPDGPDFEPAPY
jgi:hypothetical protein